MSSKIRDAISVCNAGAGFVYSAAAFFYFGIYASSMATMQKLINKASYMKKYYEESMSELTGMSVLYGILLVASICAAVFGVIHACNYISGRKRKSASGFTSSILVIILSAFWAFAFFAGLAGDSGSGSSVLSVANMLSVGWVVIVMGIMCVISLGIGVTGLIFNIQGNKGESASDYYTTAPMPGIVSAPVAQPAAPVAPVAPAPAPMAPAAPVAPAPAPMAPVTPQPVAQPMPMQQPVMQQAPVAPVAPAAPAEPQPVLQQQPVPPQNNTPLF